MGSFLSKRSNGASAKKRYVQELPVVRREKNDIFWLHY